MSKKAAAVAAVNQDLEANFPNLPLVESARDIIPGEGNAEATLFFIGEAPGYHEYVQRRPFVGKSGQLFRKVLEEVGFKQDEVYITNIVKARPPDNRDPFPAEIAAYRPFLNRELEIIEPTLIITLGRFSMAKFLPQAKISSVHGRLHKVNFADQETYVLPMYHPAAALRSSGTHLAFVSDFKKIAPALEYIKQKKESNELVATVVDELL